MTIVLDYINSLIIITKFSITESNILQLPIGNSLSRNRGWSFRFAEVGLYMWTIKII